MEQDFNEYYSKLNSINTGKDEIENEENITDLAKQAKHEAISGLEESLGIPLSENIVKKSVQKASEGVTKAVRSGIQKAKLRAQEYFNKKFGEQGPEEIEMQDLSKGATNSVQDGLSDARSSAQDFLSKRLAGLRDRAKGLRDSVTDRVNQAREDANDAVTDRLSSLRDRAEGLRDTVTDRAEGLRDSANDAVSGLRDRAQGLQDTVTEGIDDARTNANDFMSGLNAVQEAEPDEEQEQEPEAEEQEQEPDEEQEQEPEVEDIEDTSIDPGVLRSNVIDKLKAIGERNNSDEVRNDAQSLENGEEGAEEKAYNHLRNSELFDDDEEAGQLADMMEQTPINVIGQDLVPEGAGNIGGGIQTGRRMTDDQILRMFQDPEPTEQEPEQDQEQDQEQEPANDTRLDDDQPDSVERSSGDERSGETQPGESDETVANTNVDTIDKTAKTAEADVGEEVGEEAGESAVDAGLEGAIEGSTALDETGLGEIVQGVAGLGLLFASFGEMFKHHDTVKPTVATPSLQYGV